MSYTTSSLMGYRAKIRRKHAEMAVLPQSLPAISETGSARSLSGSKERSSQLPTTNTVGGDSGRPSDSKNEGEEGQRNSPRQVTRTQLKRLDTMNIQVRIFSCFDPSLLHVKVCESVPAYLFVDCVHTLRSGRKLTTKYRTHEEQS